MATCDHTIGWHRNRWGDDGFDLLIEVYDYLADGLTPDDWFNFCPRCGAVIDRPALDVERIHRALADEPPAAEGRNAVGIAVAEKRSNKKD